MKTRGRVREKGTAERHLGGSIEGPVLQSWSTWDDSQSVPQGPSPTRLCAPTAPSATTSTFRELSVVE